MGASKIISTCSLEVARLRQNKTNLISFRDPLATGVGIPKFNKNIFNRFAWKTTSRGLLSWKDSILESILLKKLSSLQFSWKTTTELSWDDSVSKIVYKAPKLSLIQSFPRRFSLIFIGIREIEILSQRTRIFRFSACKPTQNPHWRRSRMNRSANKRNERKKNFIIFIRISSVE